MLWACVLLPHLALDGVLRRRPSTDAPLVLVSGSAQARTLFSVNAAARAAGLYRGQRLTAAQALLSQFEAVEYDPAATEHWHRLLAAWAYRYSSDVVLFPHAIVLEVSKSLGLFGPWPRFEALLRELVDEATYPRLHNIAWSAAIGDSTSGFDERAEFMFGVETILDGVQALIDRS